MPMTDAKRAVIYTRMSKDSSKRGEGVARQRSMCEDLARQRGYKVVRVFSDNDISAYTGKHRPGFAALLEAITAGQVDVVLAYSVDRVYRQMVDLEVYAKACEERGVTTETINSGSLDLSTIDGLTNARIYAVLAQREVAVMRKRRMDANRKRALEGKHHKGSRRCFGYEPDGVTVRPAEADAIRWAFEHFLSGGSLGQVAKVWNEAKLWPPQGKRILPDDVQAEWEAALEDDPKAPRPFIPNPWESVTVARTMKVPRLAGIKTYQRRVVLADDGTELRGEWPAIVDYDVWKQAMAIFDGRKRTQAYPSPLLLSGVALCADCGVPVQSGGARRGRPRYRCRTANCRHVYREADPVNTYVENLIIERLSQPDAIDLFKPDPAHTADADKLNRQIRDLQARKAALGAAFAEGRVTLEQIETANVRFDADLARLGVALADALPGGNDAVMSLLTAEDVRAAWGAMPTDLRRQVIDQLVIVRLSTALTGHRAYVWDEDESGNVVRGVNPDTLHVEWRG